jgi:hypothetical protein
MERVLEGETRMRPTQSYPERHHHPEGSRKRPEERAAPFCEAVSGDRVVVSLSLCESTTVLSYRSDDEVQSIHLVFSNRRNKHVQKTGASKLTPPLRDLTKKLPAHAG